jgi:hypothetical protein
VQLNADDPLLNFTENDIGKPGNIISREVGFMGADRQRLERQISVCNVKQTFGY